MFDDLACDRPTTYTWLYHILPDSSLDFDLESFAIDYNVGDVKVRLQQIAYIDNLQLDNRKGLDGHLNPISGEDYREYYEGGILCSHNLWISNIDKAREWNFLTVIYPEPLGGQIPVIKALDDFSVQVGEDVICFDPKSEFAGKAEFLIDAEVFRQ